MARAVGSAKRSAAATAADTLAHEEDDGPVEVALNLAPLVAPYRRHTRLTIRVERLPHRGRLTRGRNNGDRSWSLMPDELDGLTYLPPKGMNDPHTLTVRLINLEGGEGATLAVHDYPIEGESPEAPDGEKSASAAKPEARNTAELRRLRDELGRLQTELGAREEELEVVRAEFELAEQSRQRVEAELSAARAGREKELRDRLATVQADAARRLDDARRAWETEHAGNAASSTQAVQAALDHARTEWRRETDAAVARAQATWKSEEAAKFAAAEARIRQQSAAAIAEAKARGELAEAELAKAKMTAGSASRGVVETEIAKAQAAWKAEEAARLAAAESRWREKSAVVAAEAKARAQAAEAELAKAKLTVGSVARDAVEAEVAKAQAAWKTEEAARFAAAESRWREQSAVVAAEAKALVQASEAELVKAKAAAASTSRSTVEAEVARAQSAWKTEEAARLAAAESQWREQSGKALAEAASRGKDAEAETARLRNELNAARAVVTVAEAKLANAESAWKTAEAARLSAAEARWQEQSATALAEMKARAELAEIEREKLRSEAESLRNRSSDAESQRASESAQLTALRVELTTAQSALSKRETELQDARGAADRAWAAMEESREIWKRESDAALAGAEANWKAGEAARLSAAEAQGRDQASAKLAEANARAAKAEAELAQARAEASVLRMVGEAEGHRPDEATVALQQTLADRESELAKAHTELCAAQAKAAEIEKAFSDWKDGEAARLTAAETRGHNHSVRALAEAQGKQKLAENALLQAQQQAEALRHRKDDAELFRLRDHVAALEAAIADRDIELVSARAEANQARDRWARDSQAKQEQVELAEAEQRHKQGHKLVRDVAIVAALALAAIVLYPRVEPVFVYGWIPNLEALATGRNVSLSDFTRVPGAAPAVTAKQAAAPAAPPQPTAVSVRAANVRSDPSTSASVIAKLPRGVEVTVKERHGSWVHVAIATGGGKTQDGWVYRTFLSDDAASSARSN